MRTEKDKLGAMELDDNVLYGIQTARAAKNFDLKHKKAQMRLINAIVLVKKAAALTYIKMSIGQDNVYPAIVKACDHILAGDADEAFITEALQGGAGTSTNMNVNEVIANLALKELNYDCGRYDIIHPLDDVNRGQSTNDVYPTALRIAAIQMLRTLSENCAKLQQELGEHSYEASSGGGMVKAEVSGKQELRKLVIDPKALEGNDVEMLQDLILAAVNEAGRIARETMEREMSAISGGIKLPGLF